MYNIDGYKNYWGEDTPVDNYNPAQDFAVTILHDRCNGFPTDEASFDLLTPVNQDLVSKAVYIQIKQVIDHFDWYSNGGASQTVSSQSVGRTSISYDSATMNPTEDINKIALSMLERANLCGTSAILFNGYEGCGC